MPSCVQEVGLCDLHAEVWCSLSGECKGHPDYIVARVVEDTGGFYSESDGSEEEEGENYTRFGWSILDVEAQRWYRIRHDDALGEEIDSKIYVRLRLAIDGGLVCKFRVFFELVGSLTVFNPLTKTTVALPFPPKHPGAKLKNGTLNFVVDETDNSFKIFIIHRCMMRMAPAGGSQGPEEIKRHAVMHIYESATGQWRSTTNPPLPQGQLGIGPFGSNVMFQGVLYVAFSSFIDIYSMRKPREYWLYSYDIEEDIWEDTGVNIDKELFDEPQLIVSDYRLFLLSWMSSIDELSGEYRASLCLSEVQLVKRALPLVFEMTSALVLLTFNLEDRQTAEEHLRPAIKGFGYGRSIILISGITGTSIEYDLENQTWNRLPTNPTRPLPEGYCDLWYATNAMNLRVPTGRRKKLKIRKSKKKTLSEALSQSRKANESGLPV